MICRCPECNGALEYNPSMRSLTCKFCGNIFRPDKVNKDSQTDMNSGVLDSEKEAMECKIYTCTSCAGELVVNDVEMATFCPYCGQPTIVFDRVSKEEKPKYIIPFKISKEEALNNIRDEIKYGFFVPKEIKNLNDIQIKGIYIPYYLVSLYYYDKQKIRVNKEHGIPRFFDREAECEFVKVPCDASASLPDALSQSMEPFDLKELKMFDESYLSGFYADMFNGSVGQIEYAAFKRCEEWFNEDMKKSCSPGAKDTVSIEESQPKVKFLSNEYALMPIWFSTFQYKKSFYTILVNGQTGKIVGTLPLNIQKIITVLIIIFLGVTGIITGMFFICNQTSPEDIGLMACLMFWYMAVLFLGIGIYVFKRKIDKINLSRNKNLAKLVKGRQERS